jgi:hypothetical protein
MALNTVGMLSVSTSGELQRIRTSESVSKTNDRHVAGAETTAPGENTNHGLREPLIHGLMGTAKRRLD